MVNLSYVNFVSESTDLYSSPDSISHGPTPGISPLHIYPAFPSLCAKHLYCTLYPSLYSFFSSSILSSFLLPFLFIDYFHQPTFFFTNQSRYPGSVGSLFFYVYLLLIPLFFVTSFSRSSYFGLPFPPSLYIPFF
jgi:hypothetical protein